MGAIISHLYLLNHSPAFAILNGTTFTWLNGKREISIWVPIETTNVLICYRSGKSNLRVQFKFEWIDCRLAAGPVRSHVHRVFGHTFCWSTAAKIDGMWTCVWRCSREHVNNIRGGFTRFLTWFTGFSCGARRTGKRPRRGPMSFDQKPAPKLFDRCRTGSQSRLEVTCTCTRIGTADCETTSSCWQSLDRSAWGNRHTDIWWHLRIARPVAKCVCVGDAVLQERKIGL